MILNDNGRTYNTEQLVAHAEGRESMDIAVYGEAFRLIYMRYVYIRQLLSESCCQQPRLDKVMQLLTEDGQLERVRNTFGYTEEEINFYLDFTERFNKMVR